MLETSYSATQNNGKILSQTTPGDSGEQITYTYDALLRLASASSKSKYHLDNSDRARSQSSARDKVFVARLPSSVQIHCGRADGHNFMPMAVEEFNGPVVSLIQIHLRLSSFRTSVSSMD